MQILIKEKKQFRYLPIGFGLILFFAISPLVFAVVGGYIVDYLNLGGTDIFAAFGWCVILTVPLAALMLIIFIGIVIHDFVLLRREKKFNK